MFWVPWIQTQHCAARIPTVGGLRFPLEWGKGQGASGQLLSGLMVSGFVILSLPLISLEGQMQEVCL